MAEKGQSYVVDGHIHIGRAGGGQAVKIAAAPSLTLEGILHEAMARKGIDIVGVIDAAAPPVLRDLKQLCATGELVPLAQGGLRYKDKVTLLCGAEVEVGGPQGGAAHFGVFVPDLQALQTLSDFLGERQTNHSLSSQRLIHGTTLDLATVTAQLEGIFVINHAFTPHKGLYGNCVRNMADMVPPTLVTAVELGLSSDTEMADRISELSTFTFVTNSDAHSLSKIAREYHVAHLHAPTFASYKRALLRQGNESIIRNVGLWPQLGKYHRNACKNCGHRLPEVSSSCPNCNSTKLTRGVWERLMEVADRPLSLSPPFRPPYVHQVPLEFIPGLGKRKIEQLLTAFGTEMNILQSVSADELCEVVGEPLGRLIEQARTGQLRISAGSGGRYGTIEEA